MLLELSTAEARDLKQALESALRELLAEIAHADQRAYRDMLKERYDRMDQLNRRLEVSVEGDSVFA
ncbi:hypothetical protein [Hyalangium minutum]|uniref:Uncharacterized protein n=1 Tax=Hyalangium minutum TaxID=394096 RepID=A0A085WEZ1_9BACT|nr:hypothetical protein [Hyalangium minutum]KFE66254.1 hypothetical protein DB31_1319 [Hyalangium minutum]